MQHLRPDLVLKEFDVNLKQALRLAEAARLWSTPTLGPRRPRFTPNHQSILIELAFLRSYLAWEAFLEESFVLYLIGKKSPRPYAPRRIAMPPTREHAADLTLPEGHRFADWDKPEFVLGQARRFFAGGQPYERAIKSSINLFQNLVTIRNAIVHRSTSSQQKFEGLVRNELGALPPGVTIGKFLGSTRPNTNPPISFLEYYLNHMARSANQIIPI